MNNKEKILVIDDELMARYAVQQVLKDRYSIFMAAGGKEGLDFGSWGERRARFYGPKSCGSGSP